MDFIAHNLRSEFLFSSHSIIWDRQMLSESDLSDAFANNAFSTRKQQQGEGTEKNHSCIERKTLISVRFSIVAWLLFISAYWVLLALATM